MIVQDVISREVKGVWGNPPQEGATLTPVIKTNNMSYEGYISFDDLTYRDIPVKKLHASFLQKGDLLIEKSGGTKTHSVGYVNIFENENDTYVCNNFIFAIRPDVNIVLPKYLFFQLKYMYETGQFSDCYNKTTGIQNLKTDRYLAKSIKCPTKSDQQKIISALDNIEQGIKVKEEQLKTLDELIQSRFTEMFESNSYEVKSIREIVANNIQTTKKVFKKEDTIQYIDISSIDNLQHSITGTTPYIVADAPSRAQQYIQYNDILVSTVRPNLKNIAINKYQDTNLIASSGFCVLRPEKCAPEYLLYNVLSNEFTTKMISLTTGASYPAVRDNDVLNYAISVPPLPLQNQFAEFVQKVEKAKEIVKIQIKDLQELLALKMDEYFK